MKILQAPLSTEDIMQLQAGEEVYVNGTVYTARDAAHKNMVESLNRGEGLPFDISGQIMYYTGPCPPAPGKVIGSAGPTTSGRMDAYAPALLKQGLKVMIGKGDRSAEVISAIQSEGAVYLAAVGGAGAYLAQRIIAAEVVAYPELGPEAVYQLKVKDFPCIVAIDARGNSLYRR
jgi:fumarate hydratase subunit beta